jgi:cell division protein FtsB
MLPESLRRIYTRSRETWLFWPLVTLIIQIMAFAFLFSDKGYFAYQEKQKHAEKIALQIANLQKQKAELKDRLKLLKNSEAALKNFSKEFYIFQEQLRILKFAEINSDNSESEEEKPAFEAWQRWYIILASAALAFVTFLSWHRDKIFRSSMGNIEDFKLNG